MSKQFITITQLSKELNQENHNVRRKLKELDIKAVNQTKRAYKTEPLKYDREVLRQLAEEFEVKLNQSDSNNNVKGSNNKVITAEMELIQQLRDDLNHERENNSDLKRLLSQAQQVSLKLTNKEVKEQDNDIVDVEVSDPVEEVKDVSEPIKDNRTLWQRILNK